MRTIILWAFLTAMAGDLLIPFLLAPFYRGYRHSTMVMSVLGSPHSPVRILYNAWLVLAGVTFILGAILFCRSYMEVSRGLSTAVLLLLLAFAVGAMVLSGFFSIGEMKEMIGTGQKIHGIGSSLGFIALLAVPLLLAVLSGKQARPAMAAICSVCFILAICAFILFIMADKPAFAQTPIAWEGVWQRLTLLFAYTPVACLCLEQLPAR